ncbi:MAG: hypothetical protein EZS28_008853 [Streblomastix strix]|uniref:Reverse transcriptase RNase H-like domain-containing protein n=1 Tax=Streblomastix strix TaxID=222440 RepID=A0A5J4WN20_9EUKA|nr:MAG: hypothetical protein EZS28_008853 [Streblomastix strix]
MDFATGLDLHQAFLHIREITEFRPYQWFRFEKINYIFQEMPFGAATAPRIFYVSSKTSDKRRLVDVETGDKRDPEPHEESRMANSRGQELDGSESGVRVSRLALESKRDDYLVNSRQEKMHAQVIQFNNEQKLKQRTDSRKKSCKFNCMNPIYRSAIETRVSIHKVVGPFKEQDCKLERLEQPSSFDTAADERSKLVTDASEDGWGATLKTQQFEKRIAWGYWKTVKFTSSNHKELLAILLTIRQFLKILQYAQLEHIRVLIDNTVAMLNLNKDSAALLQASLVNSILLLAKPLGWKIEAQHIPGIMNKDPDSIS